jgi:hypothetical protein
MMIGSRPAIGACLAIFVLSVSGCSSGGGEHSSASTAFATTTVPRETTTIPLATTTIPFATTTSPPLRVVDLAVCPKEEPKISLTAVNPGIDLAQMLVPIDALNVRVCKYTLAGSAARLSSVSWLALSVTKAFEAQTNRLSWTPEPAVACAGSGTQSTSYFLTFAVDTQTVDLHVGGCPMTVSNGPLTASVSAKWYSDLMRYTNSVKIAAPVP